MACAGRLQRLGSCAVILFIHPEELEVSVKKEELDQYLAKIRKTVSESEAMIEQVERRVAQTDELIAQSGFTREQLRKIRPTEEQMAEVNEELKRRGFDPVELIEPEDLYPELGHAAEPNFNSPEFISADEELENRKRKFNTMMQSYRL